MQYFVSYSDKPIAVGENNARGSEWTNRNSLEESDTLCASNMAPANVKEYFSRKIKAKFTKP